MKLVLILISGFIILLIKILNILSCFHPSLILVCPFWRGNLTLQMNKLECSSPKLFSAKFVCNWLSHFQRVKTVKWPGGRSDGQRTLSIIDRQVPSWFPMARGIRCNSALKTLRFSCFEHHTVTKTLT